MDRIVFDLQRFLNVTVTAGDTLVSGSAGADSITVGKYGSSVSGVTVDSGAGDDYINNRWNSSNAIINAGDGNNSVYNDGSNVKITSGAGNDIVGNYGSNVTINSGAGNDWIETYGSNVTITSGSGNDTIDLDVQDLVKITITDFDVSDKLNLGWSEPTFAKFANKTLILGDDMAAFAKINLPNVTNINNYSDMVVSYAYYWDEETEEEVKNEITLGELLDNPASLLENFRHDRNLL